MAHSWHTQSELDTRLAPAPIHMVHEGNVIVPLAPSRPTPVHHGSQDHPCPTSAPNVPHMAAELLMSAAQREITTLDEKLYLQVYGKPETHTSRRPAAAR
ncbi:MAG TPA: hypothetical protein VMA54_18285 [Steroidobacteraceae bacterium]|nr:hypothetical protein [Steroidobacteraceae bacterium]